ncbi:MAG: hypothetical protein R6X33_04160 [Candidatus Brocadiia bacterium]
MSGDVEDLKGKYVAYVDLMAAVGHTVNQAALADHLADKPENRAPVLSALDRGEERAPAEAVDRMSRLTEKLSSDLWGMLEGEGDSPASPQEVVKAVRSASHGLKDRMADALALNGHSGYIQPRYMDAEELDEILREREAADKGELALVKLVPYLCEELSRRGYDVDQAQVESWFTPERSDQQVPYCLKRLLRSLNGEFSTGLIPMEELVGEKDPDEWLEDVRERLLFRSHSAMHKAIAEASTLKYDCVHKALSGRQKAKRIQAEIKYCLDKWLEEVDESPHPDIDDDYRGVPVEWTCDLLPALETRFDTKEELYRCISEKTGIKAGSVRRYFQSNGQLKYAPLSVYRYARKLADKTEARSDEEPTSYLDDSCTRRVAFQLAQKASAALRQWKMQKDDPELEMEFKELRRELIAAIKEGWHKVPSAV